MMMIMMIGVDHPPTAPSVNAHGCMHP
jgi:hypothetical protein